MLPEVSMARIIDAIGLHQARRLSCVEAAELLGMSERHFRRLRDAYEERGAEGIVDRRRGRASGRRAPVDEVAWVVEAFRTRYFDFTAKHFHEAIRGRPMADGQPFGRSYTWTKSVLQMRGLVSKAPKRSAHRKKRARRPLPGMLLFPDVPGRLAARLAAAGTAARSRGHAGRCHERHPLGCPGRGGGHGLELHRAEGDHRSARPILGPLH